MTNQADFPSFLYQDDPAPLSEVEPCEQIAQCWGVAMAGLALFFKAMWTIIALAACHGIVCAARRLGAMPQFWRSLIPSTVVSLPIWHLTGMIL